MANIPLQGSSPYLQGSTPKLQTTVAGPVLQPAKPKVPLQGSSPTLQKATVMPQATTVPPQAMNPQNFSFMNESVSVGGDGKVISKTPNQIPTSTQPNPQTTPPSSLNSNFGETTSTSTNTGSLGQVPITKPNVETDNTIKTLREKYLSTFGNSDEYKKTSDELANLVGNTRLGVSNLEGQGRGIPLQLVKGQQGKLLEQGQIQAQTLEQRLSNLLAERGLEQNKAKTELGFADQDLQRADALTEKNKPIEVGAGGTLVRLNPTTGKYETVANGAPKPENLPASAQEYEYAVKNGYAGTYQQYQNEDANRKARAGGAGLLGGLTNSQINSTVNQIAGSFDNEPIVKNFSLLNEANQFVKSLSNSTTNPVDDQGLIYALAKALDPNSVVREGEYATAQKYAQSLVQSYGKSISQALNGTGFLSSDARSNIKKTIESRYQASLNSYNNLYRQYQQRIDQAKGGSFNSLTNYNNPTGGTTSGVATSTGGTSTNDPGGIR